MTIQFSSASAPPPMGGAGSADAPQGTLGGRLFKSCMRPVQRAARSANRVVERVKRWRSASPTLVGAAPGNGCRAPKKASKVRLVNLVRSPYGDILPMPMPAPKPMVSSQFAASVKPRGDDLDMRSESARTNRGGIVGPDGRPPMPPRPERLERWLQGDGASPPGSDKSERPTPKPRSIVPGGQNARSRSDDGPPTPPPRFTQGNLPRPQAFPVDDAGYVTLTRPKPKVTPDATWSPPASASKPPIPDSTPRPEPKVTPYATWSPSASASKGPIPDSTPRPEPKVTPYATWSPPAPKSKDPVPDSSPGHLPGVRDGG